MFYFKGLYWAKRAYSQHLGNTVPAGQVPILCQYCADTVFREMLLFCVCSEDTKSKH